MVYKLRIEVSTNYSESVYKPLLKDSELPRGVIVTFILSATNIGDHVFEGILKTITASYGHTAMGGIMNSVSSPERKIVLQTNEKQTISNALFPTYVDGVMWLKLEITAGDGGQIEFFIEKDSNPSTAWAKYFYIVNREQLDIMLLLRESLNK